MSADPDPGTAGEAAAAAGRFAEAAGLFAAAEAAEPWIALWRERRLEAMAAAGAVREALDLARADVVARPDRATARRVLARMLDAAGAVGEAVAQWREALSLDPDPVHALGLADACARAGDHREAIAVLRSAARRTPDDPAPPMAEAEAWIALGEGEKADAALARAAALAPGHPGLDALRSARADLDAGRLTGAFVRGLFDGYADRFDADLTGRLGYAAPAILARALAEAGGLPRGDRDVIDLGCGTGLSGAALRPFARRLAGVDLSPRMVERARDRGIYDRLDVGDLVEALAATPRSWDLAVAADVLVYVGPLEATAAAVATALRPGGLFAFTVERGPDADVELGPVRRYRHGEGYLRRIAADAGLDVVSTAPCVPRLDRGAPVDGLAAVFRLSP